MLTVIKDSPEVYDLMEQIEDELYDGEHREEFAGFVLDKPSDWTQYKLINEFTHMMAVKAIEDDQEAQAAEIIESRGRF